MANSIDEWIFDKEINVENVKFLKDKYRNPIMEEINSLRTLWEKKINKKSITVVEVRKQNFKYYIFYSF